MIDPLVLEIIGGTLGGIVAMVVIGGGFAIWALSFV